MQPGQIIPLASQVSLLAGQNAGRFPFCHGVLLQGREIVLVDTGAGPEVLGPLSARGGVDVVLNTHTHPDHSAGNHFFAGREILAPSQSLAQAGRLVPLSERLVEPGALARQWRAMVTRAMSFREQEPTGSFPSDTRFSLGGITLEAVHLPGHTVDHHGFFLPGPELLISGDVDLTPFGPWYGHRESNLAQMRESIQRVMEINPRILVSSHREPLWDRALIQDELRAFLGVIDQRREDILRFLKTPRTRDQVVDRAFIYGSFKWEPMLSRYWEGQMIDLHLAELLEQGEIIALEQGFRSV